MQNYFYLKDFHFLFPLLPPFTRLTIRLPRQYTKRPIRQLFLPSRSIITTHLSIIRLNIIIGHNFRHQLSHTSPLLHWHAKIHDYFPFHTSSFN